VGAHDGLNASRIGQNSRGALEEAASRRAANSLPGGRFSGP
jgi:hypothetical protein